MVGVVEGGGCLGCPCSRTRRWLWAVGGWQHTAASQAYTILAPSAPPLLPGCGTWHPHHPPETGGSPAHCSQEERETLCNLVESTLGSCPGGGGGLWIPERATFDDLVGPENCGGDGGRGRGGGGHIVQNPRAGEVGQTDCTEVAMEVSIHV